MIVDTCEEESFRKRNRGVLRSTAVRKRQTGQMDWGERSIRRKMQASQELELPQWRAMRRKTHWDGRRNRTWQLCFW